MQNYPWNVLGMEPSTSPEIIKRAYVSKLKVLHQEKRIHETGTLRAARDHALLMTNTLHQKPKRTTFKTDLPQGKPRHIYASQPPLNKDSITALNSITENDSQNNIVTENKNSNVSNQQPDTRVKILALSRIISLSTADEMASLQEQAMGFLLDEVNILEKKISMPAQLKRFFVNVRPLYHDHELRNAILNLSKVFGWDRSDNAWRIKYQRQEIDRVYNILYECTVYETMYATPVPYQNTHGWPEFEKRDEHILFEYPIMRDRNLRAIYESKKHGPTSYLVFISPNIRIVGLFGFICMVMIFLIIAPIMNFTFTLHDVEVPVLITATSLFIIFYTHSALRILRTVRRRAMRADRYGIFDAKTRANYLWPFHLEHRVFATSLPFNINISWRYIWIAFWVISAFLRIFLH